MHGKISKDKEILCFPLNSKFYVGKILVLQSDNITFREISD